MKLTIGVMGASGGELSEEVWQKAYRLGEAIAEHDAILITGACPEERRVKFDKPGTYDYHRAHLGHQGARPYRQGGREVGELVDGWRAAQRRAARSLTPPIRGGLLIAGQLPLAR